MYNKKLIILLLILFSFFMFISSAHARVFSRTYDKQINSAVVRWWPAHMKTYGPAWLKAQLYQESLLKPNAKSRAGAAGLAQFMPGTWKDMCRQMGWVNASPYDANYSIQAGAIYMYRLYRVWKSPRPDIDRWDLARASYNAGLGHILKAQKLSGYKNLYQDIIEHLYKVTDYHSEETITYNIRIHKWFNLIVSGG